MKKSFHFLDVLFSQALGVWLFIDWAQRLSCDVALGHILTSSERGASLLTGVAIAILFRSAFGRWRVFRWMARMTLSVAMVHTLLPFDRLTAVSVLVMVLAVIMEVMMRPGTLAWAARSGFIGSDGGDLVDDLSGPDTCVRRGKGAQSGIEDIGEAERDGMMDRREFGIARVSNTIVAAIGSVAEVPDVPADASTSRLGDDAAADSPEAVSRIGFALTDPDSLASYIRVQLRLMAGDTFGVSRYVMQYTVAAMGGRSAAEIDAILRRVIYAATLRQRRGGMAVIAIEDIRTALRGC
jgi:hypothetical protein